MIELNLINNYSELGQDGKWDTLTYMSMVHFAEQLYSCYCLRDHTVLLKMVDALDTIANFEDYATFTSNEVGEKMANILGALWKLPDSPIVIDHDEPMLLRVGHGRNKEVVQHVYKSLWDSYQINEFLKAFEEYARIKRA